MHMADALVVPAVAGTMYVASAITAGVSVHKIKLENNTKNIPVMGIMGAFVFATQMINFTIPGTGSSGHLCGGMLLAALLGPYAAFLSMIGVLLIQCLMFADGGILALGCNIWNMAFYSCFVGGWLIWRPIMKKNASRKKIILASVLGCILTLQLGAFSVALETLASGVTELPFAVFVATMQPIHLAIGLVEGLITTAVLLFIYEARPQLLWGVSKEEEKKGRFSFKTTLIILAAVTLFIGGGLSLVASSNPDGLEWSMERITGQTELETSGGSYDIASFLQEKLAIFPDYAFKGTDTAMGTTVSGILGCIVVLALLVGACYLFKFFRKKTVNEQN